jgi:signal transduction histidine kinase
VAIDPVALLERAFPAIGREDLTFLAGMAKLNTYPADTILCHEGANETTFYLISEGEVVITKSFANHDERILRTCGPGEFFGEMAIIQKVPRTASVKTTQETTVLELDESTLVRALSHNAPMALTMVRTTLERLRLNDLMTIRDLQSAYETLERLDRAKLDFIQVAAHELRTPLTIMRGYANMLLIDPAIKENPMLSEITSGVVNGAERLHEIVNNMLDVQKIDMATLEVASVPVSLAVVLRGVIMDFKQAIETRHLNVQLDIQQDNAIPYIEADPGLITKAMYHVVMNAIKYTPDGGDIKLSLYYVDDPDLGIAAHILISDKGIGIAKEHHQLIFEKFYQIGQVALHSSGKTAFKAGGPGLGLAIARGAVLAHGGRIWMESTGYDEQLLPGTTFHILLPIVSPKRKVNS